MKKSLLIIVLYLFSEAALAQTGYQITINLKNCRDSIAYLTYYQFDKIYVKDSCTTIENGKIIFKGKNKLNKGIYSLLDQDKAVYFDFFIDDETQNLNLIGDAGTNVFKNIRATNSTLENDFFDYITFIYNQNDELELVKQKSMQWDKVDSTNSVLAKQKELDYSLYNYEKKFIEQKKGSYIAAVLNLKTNKSVNEILKDAIVKPDSLMIKQHQKEHYWDNVNFNDNATVRNPFFYTKLINYFDNVVNPSPDSIAIAIDVIMRKTDPESVIGKLLLDHFTSTYETSKIMGYDKVFVHIVDTYYKTGKANRLYSTSEVKDIIDHAERVRFQLIGSKAPNLALINASDRGEIAKMGFETAQNSAEIKNLILKYKTRLNSIYNYLEDVKADYILLAFWDVDCSHCTVEIPKLLEAYHQLKKKGKDVKVYCVYTQQESEKYNNYINENKLDWINVYNGVRNNDIIEKYDIVITPVIYLLDKNKVIKAKKTGNEFIDVIKLLEQ